VVGAGATVSLRVAVPGVSASAVAAVMMHLTVTQPRAAGFVTAYSGSGAPGTSNVSFGAGQTIANLVVVRLSGGVVRFVNHSPGSVQLVVDLQGWFATGTMPPVTTTTTQPSGEGASGPPAGPPVQVCDNTTVLNNPKGPPAGAVMVPAGDNFNQLGLNYNLTPHTTYWFAPGVHYLENGQFNQIQPMDGDVFVGAPGAILDGNNSNEYAFTQRASNVTIEYLTIRNFVTPFNEGAVNHDSGTGWTITHDTITNIGNTADGGQSGAAIIGGVNEIVTWDCLSYDGQYGINGAGVPRAVGSGAQYTNMDIENNEFSHDAPNGDLVGGTSGAFKLWYDSDVTIKNNWVHDSGTVGMWADTNNDGVVIEGNYVDHNANEALIYEISYNALIEDNTFVDNGWKAGPGNPGFPTGAIYVFSSGGESRVPNGFGITTLTISGNVFKDNWGGVVLYQNGDRMCGFSDSGNCTLIDPTVYTSSSCQANIAETSPVDYADNCIWKTQNVTVTNNEFMFDPTTIGPSCTAANTCAFSALFGTYSAEAGHTGPAIPLAVANQQNNQFTNNTYYGGLGFTAFNQGDNVGWTQWSQGFTDGSSGDQFNPQDAGSIFN
jgi:hypothetical protein